MLQYTIYLLKVAAGIAVFYSIYWLLLRNVTYHALNRIFLMASVVIPCIIPLLTFNLLAAESSLAIALEPISIAASSLPVMAEQASHSISILSIVYISGAVFFTLKFVLGLIRITFLLRRFPHRKYKGFIAVILDTDQSAFTFFNYLFISRTDYEREDGNEVLVHEQAHRDQMHSFDVLLLEVISILQWFNPFIWALRYSLLSEHEFLADRKVLNKGYDLVDYQKLLFERSLGITTLSLTSNFNYSILKKRFKMMTINKSKATVKLRYLVAIPMVLVSILVFTNNADLLANNGEVYTEVDVMARYKDDDISGVRKFIMEQVRYPQSARDNNVSARIFVQFVVTDKGAVDDVQIARCDIVDDATKEVVVKGYTTSSGNSEIDAASVKDLEAEAIRVIQLLDGFTPATKDGKKVSTQYTFPINFILGNKADK